MIITTNLSFSEWAQVFGPSHRFVAQNDCRAMDAKMTNALRHRLTQRCHSLETGNDSYRFKASPKAAKKTGKEARTLTASQTNRITEPGSILGQNTGPVLWDNQHPSTSSAIRRENPTKSAVKMVVNRRFTKR